MKSFFFLPLGGRRAVGSSGTRVAGDGKTAAGPASGFTLVELLVVMAIIVILAVFVAPAVTTLLRGSQVGNAGQMLEDQLTLYRQLALAKNRPVEVRIYRFGDSGALGESATEPASGKYRGIQPFLVSPTDPTKKIPAAKAARLPSSVLIDSGATLSSLLNQGAEQSPAGDAPPLFGDVKQNYIYRSFQIRPDGSTDLDQAPGKTWFLTVHNLSDGDGLGTPPSNFFTIQINPFNGHTTTYRP